MESREPLIKAAVVLLLLGITFVGVRIFKNYIYAAGRKHHFAEQRTNSIAKIGQAVAYLLALAVVSNVLGFGIHGIFVATSSFFAIVGIAFFANWSILSNITASVIIYFTFPFRIGDRLVVDNDPLYTGILKDATLFYLKIETDRGSTITIPANVAIQKMIIIQSEADWKFAQEEAKLDRAASRVLQIR